MKYLKGIKTIEELKKQYRAWAKKLHPDCGGSTAEMQKLNAEYDEVFKRVKNIHTSESGETYEKETTETAAEFKEIISQIIGFNIDIEIIGCWIWCFNAYECRETLKSLGFKWASKKKAWYYHRPEDVCKSRKPQELADIRIKYGCETIKKHSAVKMLTA